MESARSLIHRMNPNGFEQGTSGINWYRWIRRGHRVGWTGSEMSCQVKCRQHPVPYLNRHDGRILWFWQMVRSNALTATKSMRWWHKFDAVTTGSNNLGGVFGTRLSCL